MKIKISQILLIAGGIFIATSCGKEGCKDPSAMNYDPDAKKDDGSCEYFEPSLSISSPQEGQMYGMGETVNIHATVEHNESMHGWSLYLVNTSPDIADTVLAIEEHEHGTLFEISEQWTNDVSMHSDMELTIRAELDHDGNELMKMTHFHCHPM